MNATNRRLAIFDKLLNEKRVVVMNLAEEFNVTPMTIRRDLSVLEKQGVITTYYGGASLNEGAASEPSFMLKNKNAIDEKMAIAYEASKLINEGDSVYIDCGTTCYNIGRFLKNKKITVLTNSIRLIETIKEKDRIDIIVAPGVYSRIAEAALSSSTIEFFSHHHVDKAFVTSQGFDLIKGASVPEEMDGKVKSSIYPISKQNILLIDHTKFGQVFFSIHGLPSEYDMIITDEGVDPAIVKQCEELGLPLRIAPYIRRRETRWD